MIVVATDDFEVYHDVVTELRARSVTFTTVEADADLPEHTTVVIAGPDESVDAVGSDGPLDDVTVINADPDEPRPAVERALAAVRGGGGRTIVGVDPGRKPGIAVLSGDVVVAAFQVPLAEAADTVRAEVEDAVDPVVRIGDGSRLEGAQFINELEDVRIELVDETGTTPSLGSGARGMGDVLAAVNIARMEGEVIDRREIEPTAGEIQVIKTRSRERSPENRAIDESLARRVATGEMTLDEALDEHRNGS